MVEFETDRRLGLGEFGIETRVVAPPEAPVEEQQGGGHTMVFNPTPEPVAEIHREEPVARPRRALLVLDGRRLVVGTSGVVIGRSRQCDIVIDDPNVSRRHAEVRPQGGAWVLSDLGSTNGSVLNGRRIEEPEVIEPGDEIEIGTSVITFELE